MPRNLDLTALRSFVAVAESGGVTRAAGYLNLTQSAVSMQLKRLEDSLGHQLFDRAQRSMTPTPEGEQLLGYARRMVEINDEIMARMTGSAYEGELVLGVPHDIVYPAVPRVLHRFNAEFPRVRVHLVSSNTSDLKAMFARGEADFIVTTESGLGAGGETLTTLPLVWVGAENGNAWRERPLKLAFGARCIFRKGIVAALDQAGIPWEMAVESETDRAIEATVAADLAVHAALEGTEPPYIERIPANCGLPELTSQNINLYRAEVARGAVSEAMAELLRNHFRAMRAGGRLQPVRPRTIAAQ